MPPVWLATWPPVGPTGLVPTASGWKPSWASHGFVYTWIDHSNGPRKKGEHQLFLVLVQTVLVND